MQERGDEIDFQASEFEEKNFIPNDLFAYELHNDGTLEELQEQIHDLLDEILNVF